MAPSGHKSQLCAMWVLGINCGGCTAPSSPVLAFMREVRRIICTTSLIESMNTRLRTCNGGRPSRDERDEGALPGRPEPRGVPWPGPGDQQLRVETGVQAFMIYFDGRVPSPLHETGTITYVGDQTLRLASVRTGSGGWI